MIKITGPLSELYAAVKAAEKELAVADKEVRDSKIQLGALMDERTRLLAGGLKPTHPQFTLLLREEGLVREELDLAKYHQDRCQVALARANANLAKWLSNG